MSHDTREDKVKAIQLKHLEVLNGDSRVIGEEVGLDELARQFGHILRGATLDSYDAGYEDGVRAGEAAAEQRRIESEHWHAD